MKALVLYRSHYGNTRRVAEAIAERLAAKGHAVIVQDVRRGLPELGDVDVAFNGAPTRMKRASLRSMGVLRKLKRRGFGRLLAIYDTCGTIPADPQELEKMKDWIVPGAAGRMQQAAKEIGLNVYPDPLRCEVVGMKGPLVENALGKAVAFADAVAAEVGRAH